MTDGTPNAPNNDLNPTLEAGEKYVNIDVMLPRGVTILRLRVIKLKHDSNCNPIGRANYNPILDSRHYLVEFEYGEFHC